MPVHSTLSEVSLGSCLGESYYSWICPRIGNVMTGAQCFCYEHSQISFLDSLFNVVISDGVNMMLISVANM